MDRASTLLLSGRMTGIGLEAGRFHVAVDLMTQQPQASILTA